MTKSDRKELLIKLIEKFLMTDSPISLQERQEFFVNRIKQLYTILSFDLDQLSSNPNGSSLAKVHNQKLELLAWKAIKLHMAHYKHN